MTPKAKRARRQNVSKARQALSLKKQKSVQKTPKNQEIDLDPEVDSIHQDQSNKKQIVQQCKRLIQKNNQLQFTNIGLQKQLMKMHVMYQQKMGQLKDSQKQISSLINQKRILELQITQFQQLKDNIPKEDPINYLQQIKTLTSEKNRLQAKYQNLHRQYENLKDDYKSVRANQDTYNYQLSRYKDEIRNLKEITQKKIIQQQPKTVHKKSKSNRIYNFHSSPFDSQKKIIPTITLETVILLKQKILNTNKELLSAINQNGEFRQRINFLTAQNQRLNQMVQNQNQQQSQGQINTTCKMPKSSSKAFQYQEQKNYQKQCERLERKVASYKKQIESHHKRTKQVNARIKNMTKLTNNLYDQFQQWKYRRNKSKEAQTQTENQENIVEPENNEEYYPLYQFDL